MLLQRLTVAHQPRFTRWGVDRDGDTGDLPMALAYQVIHRFEGCVLLFKEDAAIRRLAHFAVNDHQRRLHAVDQLQDRLFAHVSRVKHDGVALAVGEHLHRQFFLFRGIVTVGNNQLFTVRFGLP